MRIKLFHNFSNVHILRSNLYHCRNMQFGGESLIENILLIHVSFIEDETCPKYLYRYVSRALHVNAVNIYARNKYSSKVHTHVIIRYILVDVRVSI